MESLLTSQRLSPDSVLPVLQGRRGSANGITARDLVREVTKRTNAADERKLRQIIKKLRDDGQPICGHPAIGYYMASDAGDLEKTCMFLVGRAVTSLQQVSAMKRVALPDLYGQLGLPTPATEEDANHE